MTTYKLIDEKYNFAKVEPKIELIKNKELRIEGTFSNDLTYILNTLHCDELLRFEDENIHMISFSTNIDELEIPEILHNEWQLSVLLTELRDEDLTVEEYQERINYFADDRL